MQTYRVADWMSRPPIVVAPSITLASAQHLMEQHHVRRLPVVQEGQLVGIITWGDLRASWPSNATALSAYEWQDMLEHTPIAEHMTRNPITIGAHAPVLYAAQSMLMHKISGLPVVAEERVVGMITESDLFRLMIAESLGSGSADARRLMPLLQIPRSIADCRL